MTDDQWADALVRELLPESAGLQDPRTLRPLLRAALMRARVEGVEEVKAAVTEARDGHQGQQ